MDYNVKQCTFWIVDIPPHFVREFFPLVRAWQEAWPSCTLPWCPGLSLSIWSSQNVSCTSHSCLSVIIHPNYLEVSDRHLLPGKFGLNNNILSSLLKLGNVYGWGISLLENAYSSKENFFSPGKCCIWQTSALDKKVEPKHFSEVRGLHFRVAGISFYDETQNCSRAQTSRLHQNGAFHLYWCGTFSCVFVFFSIQSKRNPCQWNRKPDFKVNPGHVAEEMPQVHSHC